MGEMQTEVVAVLNERSSQVVADQLIRDFRNAGIRAGDEFGRGIEDGMRQELARSNAAMDQLGSRLHSGFTEHGRTAGRGFGSGFGSELASSLPGVSGFASAMSGYDGAAGKMGALAGRALGMAFTTAAAGLIGAAGYTLFKGFERYEAIDAAKNRLENLNRTLAQTGRATYDVKAVMDTVNNVVLDTPIALDKAFSVATRALSTNTGDLKRFMTTVADAATYTQSPIEQIGDAFLKIANSGKVSMDEMSNELRDIPLSWLSEQLGVTGNELTKMISDGKVGLETLMQAVESNVSGFAKGSADTLSGAVDQMQTAVARLGANFLGAIFGQPTDDANTLKDAIKQITDRLDEVNAWVTAHQDDIRRTFEQGVEAARDLAAAGQKIAGVLDDIGIGVGDVVEAFVAWKVIQGVTSLTSALTGTKTLLSSGLPTAANAGAAGISAALARVAVPAWLAYLVGQQNPTIQPNMLGPDGNVSPDVRDPNFRFPESAGGGRPTSPGPGALEVGPPGPPSSTLPNVGGIPVPGAVASAAPPPDIFRGYRPNPARREGVSPFSLDEASPTGSAPAGNPILPAPGMADGGGGGPKLPKAPVVPYDSTLPPSIPGMPQDASVFGAESSFLDARHRLAEKRARVAQLESDANATEQDRLNARNDVIEAERDFQAAEMRMGEARASQYEKLTKQTQQHVKDLGDIGASLDRDFGISKGLAGIAENITKFVANLAAAPLLGQLQAISQANPSQGGYGVMGVLGAQGAFGPEFTGISAQQQTVPSALGPAAWQPGMAGQPGFGMGSPGAAKPGESARSFAHRVMMPFWESQGLTVGDHAADQFGEHQNGALDIMVDSLAEGQKVLQQVLSDPNVYGAIFNQTQYGYGNGPAGIRMEDRGSPTQNHMDHVHAFYKPGGSNNIIPSSGAGTQIPPDAFSPAAAPVAPSTTGAWAPNPAPLPTMGGNLGPGGAPTAAPFANRSYGGVEPASGMGGGGVGITQGGMVDTAIGMAASGLDMLAPGAGQAAQTGVKLINRAIEYGGQVAGIGVQGAMQTFLPTGGSELANNSWFTRILGGLAGAAPALPNIAGKGAKKPEDVANIDPAAAARGEVQPTTNNTTINVTNQRATEDGTGRDVVYHQRQGNMGPGM